MEYEVKNLQSKRLYSDILSVVDGGTDFTRFKNKTVVITGASKLLSYYLACAMFISNDLNSTDISVVAVDESEEIFERYGKLTYRKDIDFIVSRNYSELTLNNADFVIFGESFRNLESSAVTNLLDFIKKHSATCVICTDANVYGDVFNGKDRIFETDMGYTDFTNPVLNYIQTQRITESLALKLALDCSLDIKLARLCKVYGPNCEDSTFSEIIDNTVHGRNLVVDMKKSMPQSYCYVTDAAQAVLTVLLSGKSAEIYNIASNCIASDFHIATECIEIYPEKELKLIPKGKATLSHMAPTLNVLDITKLCALGFTPRVELSEGVKKCVEIYAERRD